MVVASVGLRGHLIFQQYLGIKNHIVFSLALSGRTLGTHTTTGHPRGVLRQCKDVLRYWCAMHLSGESRFTAACDALHFIAESIHLSLVLPAVLVASQRTFILPALLHLLEHAVNSSSDACSVCADRGRYRSTTTWSSHEVGYLIHAVTTVVPRYVL
ncbi:hypothetical protein GJ744_001163 [Endocarpon pusillum]|uniref:Uncharacterized protein n=1 Tax=Endocarpon pusillum TaxID=364733 RepID=A0A8H7A9V4_9EURO|nr:hypothetical protein GJ744_001163 [Endocarpon pusillum]